MFYSLKILAALHYKIRSTAPSRRTAWRVLLNLPRDAAAIQNMHLCPHLRTSRVHVFTVIYGDLALSPTQSGQSLSTRHQKPAAFLRKSRNFYSWQGKAPIYIKPSLGNCSWHAWSMSPSFGRKGNRKRFKWSFIKNGIWVLWTVDLDNKNLNGNTSIYQLFKVDS